MLMNACYNILYFNYISIVVSFKIKSGLAHQISRSRPKQELRVLYDD